MTVLIETRTLDLTTIEGEPPAELTAELAWCLRRFVVGRADECAMRRAGQALRLWEEWSAAGAIEPPG
jgi:hypothetical protein